MPNNWKIYKLGELGDIKGGKRLPKGEALVTSKTKHPYVRVTDMGTRTIPIEKLQYVPDDVFPKISRYIVNTDDLIISIVGTVGSVSIIDKKLDNASLTENCVKITNYKNIDKEYLYYFLTSDIGRFEISKGIVGSTQPKLPIYNINDLEISLPENIEEQKSIAAILSAIDDKIENNLAINKTLEEMAMALYKHWFVDFGPFQDGEFVESELGRIPKGWEVKSLGEIADFINGYAFKSGDLKSEDDGNSYHVFKMGHIERGGGLKENATKSYIEKIKCQKLEKYILKVGDLLMAMTDMKDNVAILGNTALINENDKYIVNQRVGLIRPKNQIGIDYSFLYLTTNENSFIERLRSQANSGVQVNLSTEAIKSAKMIIASEEVNKKFDDLVKPLYNNIFQNKIESQTLTQLRDTLLPKLISGEVRLKEFQES